MTQLQSSTSAAPQASGPINTLRLAVSGEAGNSTIFVTITPPNQPGADGTPEKRAPVDLCCVIDVSGSMDDDAAVPSETDKPLEVTGLSVMDVTKHAMKTIIASMGDDDRLALVSFTNHAKVVANLTRTNAGGKASLLRAVESLRPENSTNLWDGLKVGMNTLNEQSQNSNFNTLNRVQSVFILTDGMPNVEPPRGHIPSLKRYLEANPQTRFNVSTFGFGYSLDSKLLSEIAKVGGGSYGFIPDAGMVGTVFVHALANLFSTYAPRAILNVDVPEGITLKPIKGSYPSIAASWGSRIEIGDIQYGQTRQFIIELEGINATAPPEVTVSLTAQPWFASDKEDINETIVPSTAAGTPSAGYLTTKYRLDSVTYIYQLCGQYQSSVITNSTASAHWTSQAVEIQQTLPDNADALSLAADMAGELHLAVSSQANWKKWGVHYFPSLARAHQREQCSNFKDAGVQVYGRNSPLFLKSRDEVDATFDNLPPPKPSKTVKTQAQTQYSRGVNYQSLHSMQQYNMRSGPCMAGDSLVTLANGNKVRTDIVTRGAVVETPKGPRVVSAVIKTPLSSPVALCTIGQLRITPWHPIQHEGTWKFPADVVQPEYSHIEAIYSFLLQPSADADAHAMNIGGVTCVTFGHGIVSEQADARSHSFFGSYDKVLASVASLPGFHDEDGVARCGGVLRDASSLICGLVPLEQAETTYLSEKRAVELTA